MPAGNPCAGARRSTREAEGADLSESDSPMHVPGGQVAAPPAVAATEIAPHHTAAIDQAIPPHPPGYRLRRGRNWFFLGLLYAGFYLCRYNLGIVAPELKDEFH